MNRKTTAANTTRTATEKTVKAAAKLAVKPLDAPLTARDKAALKQLERNLPTALN